MRKVVVTVNGKNLHLVLGKSITDWAVAYADIQDFWNVPLEELLDGTLEINEEIWYWYINGRCFETDEEVNN